MLFRFGIVATGFSLLMFMHGIRYVAGQHALIITSLETVIPAGFAWLIFGESLSKTALAACAMILIGVLWVRVGSLVEREDDLDPAPTGRMKPISAG